MNDENIDYEIRYFRATTVMIKLVVIMLGITMIFFSQFGFIFYSIAMIPAVIVSFIDKQYQSSASATVCTFNLIGIMPFLARLWDSNSIDASAKIMSTDISTWVVIYGCALLGQTLYWLIPPVIAKLYMLKSKVEVSILTTSREKLVAEWSIKKLTSNDSNK